MSTWPLLPITLMAVGTLLLAVWTHVGFTVYAVAALMIYAFLVGLIIGVRSTAARYRQRLLGHQ